MKPEEVFEQRMQYYRKVLFGEVATIGIQGKPITDHRFLEVCKSIAKTAESISPLARDLVLAVLRSDKDRNNHNALLRLLQGGLGEEFEKIIQDHAEGVHNDAVRVVQAQVKKEREEFLADPLYG